jgi:hypothetical protein
LSRGHWDTPIVLAVPITVRSPYMQQPSNVSGYVLASNDSLGSFSKHTKSKVVVLPLECAARRLAPLLEQAPIVRRGPISTGEVREPSC